MEQFYLPLAITAAILVALVITLFIIRARIRRTGEFSHSLGLGLLKVQLPPERRKDDEKIGLAELQRSGALGIA